MKRFLTILFLTFLVTTLSAKAPYLILISFDGFRWDYHERGLTSHFDFIAKNGVKAMSLEPVFPSKTFPNHLSIVTGMHPQNHGILANDFFNPYTGEHYALRNREEIQDPKWYMGEMIWETANRNGIITASYFWPGSELEEPRKPTIREMYEHNRPFEDRVDGVLDWLELPKNERPQFMTLYFHEVDSKGHRFGPNSPEVNTAISDMNVILGRLLDGLVNQNMLDSVNIVITSDHGMTEVHTDRLIDIEEMVDGIECEFSNIGPFMMIRPKNEADISSVYQKIKARQQNFITYYKKDFPEHFHFSDHPFISPIILLADMGWSLHTTRSANRLQERPGAGGNHGYDNFHMDMHGIFYAMGPSIRKGYPTGTIRAIDVYPLLCELLGIKPRSNIDGDINRIKFILKP